MCRRQQAPFVHKPYTSTLHLLSHPELCDALHTHPLHGLSTPQAQALLIQYGPNSLKIPSQPNPFFSWAKELLDPFLLLLFLASCLAFISFALTQTYQEVVLAGALLVIVFLGATTSYLTKREAAKIIDAIRHLMPSQSKVIRDGKVAIIPTSSLVIGDLVPLELGNRIPADLCLLSCNNLSVDNSSITGESEPIDCVAERASDFPLEARNLVFCSSICLSGEGLGVVCSTGDSTFVGSIARAAGGPVGGGGATVHAKEFRRLLIFVSILSLTTGCIFLAIGLGRGLGVVFSITQAFILTLVANVPEGLPATVLVQLTLGAKKLAKKGILVKDVAQLPTMGAITVLCTDKTGTLTLGKMTVSSLWDCSAFVRAEGVHVRGGPTNTEVAQQHEAAVRLNASMSIGRQLSIVWPHERGDGGIAVIHASSSSSSLLPLPPSTTAAHSGALIPPGETSTLIHRALSNPSLMDAPPSHRLLIARSRSIASRRQMRHASIAVGSGGSGGGGGGGGVTLRSQVSHIAITVPTLLEEPLAAPQPPEGEGGGQVGGEAAAVPTTPSFPPPPPSWVPWDTSTAFTRLITIAAVCNKAQILEDTITTTTTTTTTNTNTSPPSTSTPPTPPKVLGNASDAALLLFANSLLPIHHWSAAYPLQSSTVFNSQTKIATVTCSLPCSPGKYIFMVKGAPERVLALCSMRLKEGMEEEEEEEGGEEGGDLSSSTFSSSSSSSSSSASSTASIQEVPITTLWKESWHAAYERFALNGERVLGFAYGSHSVSDASSLPTSGLCFAGLISLQDPPKPGALNAILRCRQAGIKVVCITGDHPLTAESIARRLNIITLPTAREVGGVRVGGEEEGRTMSIFHDLLGEIPATILPSPSAAATAATSATASSPPTPLRGDPRVKAAVVTGYQLAHLSSPEIDAVLNLDEVVFARTSPEQKSLVVMALQRLGHCVGMTGDGSNDSPALKCCNVGIVMAGGESVSDIARESGDVIVLDSNIESVLDCVEEGRLISVNMRKAIAYTLAHAIPELLPVGLNLIFDVPLMLPGLLVLVIDVLTEQVPAVSLTYEAPERDLMSEPPRNLVLQPLFDFNLVLYSYIIVAFFESLTCVGAFFLAMSYYGYPISTLLYNRSFWESPSIPPPALAALRGSVSAYFFTLVMSQSVHLYVVKTRRISMFVHRIFSNYLSQLGVVIGVVVAVLVIYPLQGSLFGTGDMNFWVSWTLWILFGIFFIVFMEAIKFCARKGWTSFP